MAASCLLPVFTLSSRCSEVSPAGIKPTLWPRPAAWRIWSAHWPTSSAGKKTTLLAPTPLMASSVAVMSWSASARTPRNKEKVGAGSPSSGTSGATGVLGSTEGVEGLPEEFPPPPLGDWLWFWLLIWLRMREAAALRKRESLSTALPSLMRSRGPYSVV